MGTSSVSRSKQRLRNFGTGPIPKDRGLRFQYALLIVTFVFFTVYAGFPGETFQQSDAWHILVLCLWMMFILGIGEAIRRIGLLVEELCHLKTRYRGQYMLALKEVFGCRKHMLALYIPTTLALVLVFVFWFNVMEEIVGNLKHISILVMLFVYQIFSFGKCSDNSVEESSLLEKERRYVSYGLAWCYYIGYLKLVLPHYQSEDAAEVEEVQDSLQVRKLRATAVTSTSVQLTWELPKYMSEKMSHFRIEYTVCEESKDTNENSPLSGQQDDKKMTVITTKTESTVTNLCPLTRYMLQVSCINIDQTSGPAVKCVLNTGGDIRERMTKFEEKEKVHFPIKKLFVLLPVSCYIPTILGEHRDRGMEHVGALDKIEMNRAGNVKRVYQNSVYRIKLEGSEAEADKTQYWYVAVEGCTPVLTLYEMAEMYFKNSQLTAEEKQRQLQVIVKVLQETIECDPQCKDLCEFIYYNDTDKGRNRVLLSNVIKARIQELKSKV